MRTNIFVSHKLFTLVNYICRLPSLLTLKIFRVVLKVQSCKLYSDKYMVVLTQITNTELYAFTAVLVFKSLSGKVLVKKRKDNRNC